MPKLVKSNVACFVNGTFVPANVPYSTDQYDAEDVVVPDRITIMGDVEDAEFEDVTEDDSLEQSISSTDTAVGAGMLDVDSNTTPATDAAKALAKEYSVNLDDVVGTGARGQITKDDVNTFISDNSSRPVAPDGDGEI